MVRKSGLALFFGNRGFFPASLQAKVRNGRFTDDPIPDNFFGAAGVAEINRLQDVLLYVGMNGYRHHVGVTPGKHVAPLKEALEKYLNFDVTIPQME